MGEILRGGLGGYECGRRKRMNPSASKEFRKDDVVVCRYEHDDLLGKIVEKEGE